MLKCVMSVDTTGTYQIIFLKQKTHYQWYLTWILSSLQRSIDVLCLASHLHQHSTVINSPVSVNGELVPGISDRTMYYNRVNIYWRLLLQGNLIQFITWISCTKSVVMGTHIKPLDVHVTEEMGRSLCHTSKPQEPHICVCIWSTVMDNC